MPVENSVRPTRLRSLPRRQIIISFLGIMTTIFLSSLDQTVVGTAMPRIIADLGGFSHYTWVATAYIIASAVVIPITGRFTDIYGRKMFFIAGLLLFLIASLACGFSMSMAQLIIGRGIQGLGAGVMMTNAFTAIGDLFSPVERGKYVGFVSAMFGLSSVIGPTLGGFITDILSWHWIFFLNLPLGIIALILFALFFPNIRPANDRHIIDYAGVAALILVVVPAMLALTWGGVEFPWGSVWIIGLFLLSIVALGVFYLVEQRCPEPIIPLSLFSDGIVSASLVVALLIGFGMFGSIIFIPLFFQGVLGMTATASGSFLTPMMLGTVFGSFISGQMLSRLGGHYKRQGIVGIAVMAVGMMMLTYMSPQTGYLQAVMTIIITGFGLGLTMPLYTIAVQNALPYRLLGIGTSLTAFSRSLGGSIGLAVLGTVMHKRLIKGFPDVLPESLKAVLTGQQVMDMADNPQLLINPERQEQLRNLMTHLDVNGAGLYDMLVQAIREALSNALSCAFAVSLAILAVAFIVNLLLKEMPLRKHQ